MSGSVTRHGWYSPTLKAMSSASFVDGFGPIPRSRRHYDHSPFPSVRDRPGAGPLTGRAVRLGESAGGCPDGLLNPERFAARRMGTILCGSNVGTDDFARWVLGDG
jgi:hypothetical protein